MPLTPCPCSPHLSLAECCGRYHAVPQAPTPEALMRSRYSAFVLGRIDYIVATTLPVQQAQLDQVAIQNWSQQSTWLGLEVHRSGVSHSPDQGFVEFTARWCDADGQHQHDEHSLFVRHQGRWYFVDPNIPRPHQ